MRVLHVFLQADDGKALESTRLVHHRVQTVRIVKRTRHWILGVAASWRLGLKVVVLVAAGSLLLEVRRFVNHGFVEYLGLDRIRVELNVQAPLFDFLRLRNHLVELLDGVDTVLWLLEETLTHLCHRLLVLTHLLGDADEHGELGRQVDVLPLLLDFKQRLVHLTDLHVVLLLEIAGH